MTRVAGGRAKRRRLALALQDRPAMLADGRSPAPRSVGDLLVALRTAGSVDISPPICATCGMQLRTLQRRGQGLVPVYVRCCSPATTRIVTPPAAPSPTRPWRGSGAPVPNHDPPTRASPPR